MSLAVGIKHLALLALLLGGDRMSQLPQGIWVHLHGDSWDAGNPLTGETTREATLVRFCSNGHLAMDEGRLRRNGSAIVMGSSDSLRAFTGRWIASSPDSVVITYRLTFHAYRIIGGKPELIGGQSELDRDHTETVRLSSSGFTFRGMTFLPSRSLSEPLSDRELVCTPVVAPTSPRRR